MTNDTLKAAAEVSSLFGALNWFRSEGGTAIDASPLTGLLPPLVLPNGTWQWTGYLLLTLYVLCFLHFARFHRFVLRGPRVFFFPLLGVAVWQWLPTWRSGRSSRAAKVKDQFATDMIPTDSIYQTVSSRTRKSLLNNSNKNNRDGDATTQRLAKDPTPLISKTETACWWFPYYSKCVVVLEDTALCRNVLTLEPTSTILLRKPLNPNEEIILGKRHLAFMTGPEHTNLRSTLRTISTQQNLGPFLECQERCIRKHLELWSVAAGRDVRGSVLKQSTPLAMRAPAVLEGESEVPLDGKSEQDPEPLLISSTAPLSSIQSEQVFSLVVEMILSMMLGPFASPQDTEEIKNLFQTVTKGFGSLPLYFPGTALYAAAKAKRQCVRRLEEIVQGCIAVISTQFLPKEAPPSILETWLPELSATNLITSGTRILVPRKVAETLFSILLGAYQGLVPTMMGLLETLRTHPDVVQRLAVESVKVRQSAGMSDDDYFALPTLKRLEFAHRCALEQIRLEPPVLPVPTVLMDNYFYGKLVFRKGTVLVPSLKACCRFGLDTKTMASENAQSTITTTTTTIAAVTSPTTTSSGSLTGGEMFQNPSHFDPDRYGSKRKEHQRCSKSLIPFGAGPHMCPGQRHSEQILTAFLSLAVHSLANDEDLRRLLLGEEEAARFASSYSTPTSKDYAARRFTLPAAGGDPASQVAGTGPSLASPAEFERRSTSDLLLQQAESPAVHLVSPQVASPIPKSERKPKMRRKGWDSAATSDALSATGPRTAERPPPASQQATALSPLPFSKGGEGLGHSGAAFSFSDD